METQREPIAIIGIGCRFPGNVTGPQAFWEMLCAGVDATRELPADRWEIGKFYAPDNAKLGKMNTIRGGFLDRIDQFDAQFFGISPREAIWLDPQQRILLQVAYEALEDSGQVTECLAGSDTGVFMAGFTLDYQLLQNYGIYSRYELQTHSATGMMMTMLANRLSYAFDFRGPSLAVDTACSGSLVAVHLAAQSIWNGECSLALAGGVNVIIAPNMTIAESKGGFLSPDGRCKAFDAAADGYARGEGSGVVLLKPLRKALADRDPIYALIRGTAVSQDGHSNGITVPNGASQEAAMRAAYQRAGIAPHEVQYVEAHGTGTPVGDPIEARAIGTVLSEGRTGDQRVVIGSVKTNIGHLEAAAGVAGVIKTALALRHGRIPGQLPPREPNPEIPFEQLRLHVQTAPGDWPASTGPRYAGVNSFGFGGTNAHAVLQEPPPEPDAEPRVSSERRYLIPLSVRTPDALTDMARSLGDFLAENPHHLEDVGYTRSLRRSHHDHRLAVVAATPAELAERLASFADRSQAEGVSSGRARPGERPKVAFVCSGMGPQWWAMGRQLLETEPVFRQAVERCDKELRTYTGWSLLAELLAPEHESRMAETEVAQPTNFALQIGLAELWRSWGVEPDAVVGHSTGEVAAQYIAGVLSFEDAVKVVYYRSSLQQRATGAGRMLAVGLTSETLNQVVNDAGPMVSVAAINSASSVTLSGDATILESMAAQLENFGVFHRFLKVKVPYHSHCMDPLREDLETGLADLRSRSATVPLYSTVTGSRIDGNGVNAHYWWQNVRKTVLFAAAFREMLADGYHAFVELGPHPVLAAAMRELLAEQEQEALIVPSLRRDEPDDAVLLRSLGTLYTRGQPVHWGEFYGENARLVRLPTYPWQLERYWNESAEAWEDRHYTEVHPLLGQRMNAVHPTWERELDLRLLPALADHRVQDRTLLPGAAYIELALAAGHDVFGDGDPYEVQNLKLHKALVLGPDSDPRLRTTLNEEQARVEIATFSASPRGAREWAVHATARLGRRPPARARCDLEGIRRGCERQVSRTEFYELTERMGFQYGPAFRAVEEIVAGPDRAVGRVTIPDAVRVELDGYRFHPSLIDAAFQVLITAASTNANGSAATPYLPVGIDRIAVLADPVEEMHVVVRVTRADDRFIVSDIAMCDPDGRVLVDIQGFRAQSLEFATSLTPARIDKALCEVRWTRAPRTDHPEPAGDPQAADGRHPGTWVLFADRAGVASTLAERLRGTERRIVTVDHGEVGQPVHTDSDSDSYTIDPTAAEHFRRLLRDLDSGDGGTTIVHLWSLDSPFDEIGDSAAALRASQDIGVLSITHLVQAMSEEIRNPRLWLVTRHAQAVGDGPGPIALAQAPLWGLARVIGHQEFTGSWGGILDLDNGPVTTLAERLLEEIERSVDDGDGEDQVAFRNDERYVPRLVECDRLTPPFPLRMRADGSYLVTGGLGALGLVVARFLVERGARSLVLMGRTPMPPRASWRDLPADHPRRGLIDQLLELERRGVTVHCAAVDVADEGQLREWLDEHDRLGRPPIRGVVHTAGVVDDQLLARMSRESFERVLAPKLLGGWLLHQLLAEREHDFFVLFSSTGSVIASPGQGNYAAANAFLDALAHHRRSLGLPAVSIGWGPWSVGMVQDLNLEQMYARRGIDLITPETGTRILGRVLGQRPAHLVAVIADWARARETSVGGRLPAMFSELGVRPNDSAAAEGESAAGSLLATLRQTAEAERPSVVAARLHEVVAQVLDLGPEAFDDDDALSALGIDSMTAIEVKHRIDQALRVDIPVLDLLQGTTINALAGQTLSLIDIGGSGGSEPGGPPDSGPLDEVELEELLRNASEDELEQLLADLERDPPGEHRSAEH